MPEKSSVFDMIGPVMIGPSSSHTAGVVRIGRVAKRWFRGTPKKCNITFYNSFARTYQGHGSDRAILAGLMDFKTDDPRIKDALKLAEESKIEFSFKSIGSASTMHPNTVKIETFVDDLQSTLVGESLGGGVIRIREINDFECNFTAGAHTLIILAQDIEGSIAFISNVISHEDCNIGTMTVSRKAKNDQACLVFQMDSGIRPLTLDYIRSQNWVQDALYIPDIDY